MAASEARFLQVAGALIAGEAPIGHLLGMQERAVFVAVDDGSVAIVIWPSLQGDALLEGINEVLERDRVTHLKLLIVGGGDDMADVLRRVKRSPLSRRMIQTFQLRDDGEVWAGKASWLRGPFGARLLEVARAEVPEDGPDRAAIAAALPPPMDEGDRQRAIEHLQFVDAFQAAKSPLSWGIAGFLGVVYLLEELWGGAEFIPTLIRMGANTHASLDDEPWRLLASASLHAGIVHFALNTFVLIMLGRFLEKILGWERLAVLYVGSAAAGAVASALAGSAVSVGASGAIWGFLGAAVALTLRPGKILPRNLVPSLRRTAFINLIINLGASFLPQIDMWAHFGGGAAGAGLVFTGLLTAGLSAEQENPRRTGWRIAAGAALLSLLSSMALGIVQGRPWEVTAEPRWTTHALGDTGISVEVPELLGAPVVTTEPGEDNGADYAFGGLGDPYGVVVRVFEESLTAQDVEREREAFLSASGLTFEGATQVGQAVVEGMSEPAVEQVFEAPGGLRIRARRVLFTRAVVIAHVEYFVDGHPEHEAVAERVLASLSSSP